MDLPNDVELDLWLRYVDQLSFLDIDAYLTLDARIGWKPAENIEISLIGQNLLDDQHLEFIDESLPAKSSEVQRSIYTKITWTF